MAGYAEARRALDRIYDERINPGAVRSLAEGLADRKSTIDVTDPICLGIIFVDSRELHDGLTQREL